MARVSSPVFIGRESELRRVTALLDAARDGRPGIVLIGGEAGVGKTRFTGEVASRARRTGFRVLEGGCVQLGADHLPYGPLIEAFRPLPGVLEEAELAGLVGTGREALATVMPGLRHGAGPRSAGDASPGQTFEQLLLFVGRLATVAPLALVIEDVHWSDATTLEFLAFAARNLRDAPIVLIATYRSDELARRHPLRPLLGELERGGRATRVVLERFDQREVAEQLEAILGKPPDGDLVAGVFDRSEGNPFLAEELLAAGPSGLTDALQDLLLNRFASLTPPTQDLIRIASVGGARFDATAVAQVALARTVDLDLALREAVDGHVLVASPVTADRYSFRHSLLRDAIYADLLPGQRARLHARFAEILDGDPSGRDEAGRLAELAYHWLQANDLPRAFEASIRAGLAAEAMYALADARASYERALDLWDAVGDAPARSPLNRDELLFRLALATNPTSPAKARELLRAAIDLVDAAADPQRALLLRAFLAGFTYREREAALEETRLALELVPRDPPSPARARALMQQGAMYLALERATQAVPALEEAIDTARALTSLAHGGGPLAAFGVDLTAPRRVESVALEQLGLAWSFLGDVPRGLGYLNEARSIAQELGIHSREAETWLMESEALSIAGRFEAAVGAAMRGAEHAAAHGMAGIQGAICLYFAARSLFALGRWGEGAERLEEAFRTVRDSAALAVIEGGLARLAVASGRPAEAARLLARHRAAVDRSVWPLMIATHVIADAELALWSGDAAAARDRVAGVMPRLSAGTPARMGHLGPVTALGVRAEADVARAARTRSALAEAGEAAERAQDLLTPLRSLAEETARLRPALSPEADGWLAMGEAEVRRADGDADGALWEAVAGRWGRLDMPYEQAYALMRQGQAELVAGSQRSQVGAILRDAHRIAANLPARPLLQLLDDLAARAGVRFDEIAPRAQGEPKSPPSGSPERQRAVGGRYALTLRELEVLDLLVAGRKDAEIADDLFISKKTVSVHINNIKGKLSAESRIGIITAAIARGLIEAPKDRSDQGPPR